MLYKTITPADSPVNLTATAIDAINSNQNSLVLDVSVHLGSVVINLPSINSLLNNSDSGTTNAVGAGGFSFFIKGNIYANAPSPTALQFVAANGDDICGAPSQATGTAGTCFHIFIAGLNRWGMLVCAARRD
jgi:hypothetical protein